MGITATEIRTLAQRKNADSITVSTNEGQHISIAVTGMTPLRFSQFKDEALSRRAPAQRIDIEHDTQSVDESSDETMLTDSELVQFTSAMPDGWECESAVFAVEDVDWETLEPLIDEYGGVDELCQAVINSVDTTPPEIIFEADCESGERDTSPYSDADTVYEVKQAFIETDGATIAMFESALESVLERADDLYDDVVVEAE